LDCPIPNFRDIFHLPNFGDANVVSLGDQRFSILDPIQLRSTFFRQTLAVVNLDAPSSAALNPQLASNINEDVTVVSCCNTIKQALINLPIHIFVTLNCKKKTELS
jgi:hypothetical protein